MNGINIRIAIIAGGLVWSGTTWALTGETISRETSYKTIAERNPFGLKSPPPPAAPPVTPPPPKGDIKLTGITAFGARKAYFMTTEPKGGKAEPTYYSLGVDEKKDGLEVVEIDEVSKSVKIRNSGIETVLTFASHGIAPPAASPAGPATPGTIPGVPGLPGIPNPNAAAAPANAITPAMIAAGTGGGTSIRTIPPRTPRGAQADTTVQYTGALAQRYGLSQPGSGSVPQPAVQESHLSSEEQTLLMELNRVANPHLKLPPTPGLPETTMPPPQMQTQPVPGLPGQSPTPMRYTR
jgi:hypothetical protein